jgi:hypothetical protein
MVARWLLSHKNMFILSVEGVTLASALSASAINLTGDLFGGPGIFGAGLIPLPKATCYKSNPVEQNDRAMAIFCATTLLGDLRAGTRIH